MEVKSFNFFLRVPIENQTHGCIPALPTDFSPTHAKRRWDGLFLFAGRVKFLSAAVAPMPLYLVGSGGDQEPESSAGKLGSKRSLSVVVTGWSSPQLMCTWVICPARCHVVLAWFRALWAERIIFKKRLTTAVLRLLVISAIRNFSVKSVSARYP